MKDVAVYIDLDGVLADYHQGFRRDYPDFEVNLSPEDLLPGSFNPHKRAAYDLIKGTDFYARLPLMSGAIDLYVEVLKHDPDPVILTAAPKFGSTEDAYHLDPYWLGAAYHKRNWVERVFLLNVYAALGHQELVGGPVDGTEHPDPPIQKDGYSDGWYPIWLRADRNGRAPISDNRFICTTSAQKWEFMHRKHSDHQILIDDRIDNIERWTKAGGIGVLHKDAQSSIAELRKIVSQIH